MMSERYAAMPKILGIALAIVVVVVSGLGVLLVKTYLEFKETVQEEAFEAGGSLAFAWIIVTVLGFLSLLVGAVALIAWLRGRFRPEGY